MRVLCSYFLYYLFYTSLAFLYSLLIFMLSILHPFSPQETKRALREKNKERKDDREMTRASLRMGLKSGNIEGVLSPQTVRFSLTRSNPLFIYTQARYKKIRRYLKREEDRGNYVAIFILSRKLVICIKFR